MPFTILPLDAPDREPVPVGQSDSSRYIGDDRKRGPIEHAHRVRKGFTRADLARLFADRGYKTGAEIGVADGRNSLTLCQNIPGLTLHCVDPWLKYPDNPRGGPQSQHDGNYERAQQRLAGYDVHFHRGFSVDVVRQFERDSLDFVFIDGHHGYQYVLEDLTYWSYRVRSGGMVSGHDFYEFAHAGVVEAVIEHVALNQITDWSICDEREPSFFWVKP